MPGLRTVAAIVSAINGVWGIIAGSYWHQIFGSETSMAFGTLSIVVLGVVLLLDSLVCVIGSSKAFYASAALSAVMLVAILAAGPLLGAPLLLSVTLGGITVVLAVLGARRKQIISEADHPLNLPVFG